MRAEDAFAQNVRHRSPPRQRQESAAAAGEEDTHSAGSCCRVLRLRGRSAPAECYYSLRGCIGVNGPKRQTHTVASESARRGTSSNYHNYCSRARTRSRSTPHSDDMGEVLGDTWPSRLAIGQPWGRYFCVDRRSSHNGLRGGVEARFCRIKGVVGHRSHACWPCRPAAIASGRCCCARVFRVRGRRLESRRYLSVSDSFPILRAQTPCRCHLKRTETIFGSADLVPCVRELADAAATSDRRGWSPRQRAKRVFSSGADCILRSTPLLPQCHPV